MDAERRGDLNGHTARTVILRLPITFASNVADGCGSQGVGRVVGWGARVHSPRWGTSHDAARNVGDLDRSFLALPGTVNHYSREVDRAEVRTRRLNRALNDTRNPINMASGRLTILGSAIAATLPTLVPLGAGTVQLLSGKSRHRRGSR